MPGDNIRCFNCGRFTAPKKFTSVVDCARCNVRWARKPEPGHEMRLMTQVKNICAQHKVEPIDHAVVHMPSPA